MIGRSVDVAVSARSSADLGIVYDRTYASFDSSILATESDSGYSQVDESLSLVSPAIELWPEEYLPLHASCRSLVSHAKPSEHWFRLRVDSVGAGCISLQG